MEQANEIKARCDTVVVCLAIIIAGQGYLLRSTLSAGPSAWSAAVIIEMFFCVVMLAAIIWCWNHTKGWTNNAGCIAAFAVFGVYLIFNIIFYSDFSGLYLIGLNSQTASYGKGLVAVKLVLAILAVVAGIPASPAPTGREYAEKLRQAVYRQDAEWAKGSAKGAKKDLESALQKLKENLSPEEMDALLSDLRSENPDILDKNNDEESFAEKWRGWGGGI